MSLRIKILLLLFALSYLAYHFFTLSLNPVPWFDEVFFASISRNFLEAGSFVPEVSRETFRGEETLVYGPVHFFLESASFKVFGFGIWQYRWVILVFGFITILTTASLFRLYHPASTSYYWMLMILFALDPFVNLSMHEGRMDLVTIAFMLLGIYFLVKGLREEGNKNFFFSGFFAVVAILTTPRIGIVILPAGIVFLCMLEGEKLKAALWKILLWSLPIIVLYSCWMLYAYGGISGAISYYKKFEETGGDYLGGRLYIPRHEYLLIALSVLSVVFGVYKQGKRYFNVLSIISILSIVLFYIVVVDWGPYSAIILPFYYFLFMHGWSESSFSLKSLSCYPILLLFVFNLSYFSLKSIQVFSERENRSYLAADEFIRMNIPKGSKVIGDGQYYYSVIRSNSTYRIYDQYLSVEEREKLLREEYDYDYVIITERSRERDPEMIALLPKNAELKKVAEKRIPQSEISRKIASLGIISDAERSAYNAEIYVRIKKYESPVASLE